MQSGYLLITIGVQFFLLVGYFFYFIFRKWPTADDQVWLMSWTAGLLGVLTLGLVVSIAIVIPRMVIAEAVMASALVIADIIGLYLLVDDTRKKTSQIDSAEQTNHE